MPAAVAIPSLISAGTSLAQTLVGSRAAKKAAGQQAEAAERAARTVQDTAGEVVPWVRDAGERAAGDVLAASERAATGMDTAVGGANRILGDVYADVRQTGVTPYTEVGGRSVRYLGDLLAPEGEFNRNFSIADYEQDPGYRFRLEEGQKALQKSAAVRGMLNSGQTLKALTGYAQGMAAQEYQNAFQRFMDQRKMRYGMLSDLATMGQRGADLAFRAGATFGGAQADNLMRGAAYSGDTRMRGSAYAGDARLASERDAARLMLGASEYAGDAYMGRGNAEAAGTVGSANAWSRGIGDWGRTAQDFVRGRMSLGDLLRPGPPPDLGYYSGVPRTNPWIIERLNAEQLERAAANRPY